VEPQSSDSLNDSSSSAVLIGGQVVEVTLNQLVLIAKRLARELTGDQVMEDTESVATIRVSMVVSELTKLSVLRADVGVVRRSHGSQLGVIPVTIAIRTSSVVISELVIRMSNPEGGRSLISIDKGEGGLSLDDQVAIDQTLGLSSILDEDGMTYGVVSHIVLYLEVVYSVESNCTIVGLMNGIVASVGLVYSTDHVEMNRVAT